jgi:hypothetical protein
MGFAYALIVVVVDDDDNVFLALQCSMVMVMVMVDEKIYKYYVTSYVSCGLSEKVKGMFCHKWSVH